MGRIDWNNFVCYNCGCPADSMGISENSIENITCPYCGTIYTLKDYNLDKYDLIYVEKEKYLNNILKNYNKTKDNAKIIAEVNMNTSKSYDLIKNVWFGFIIETAKLARDFKDSELLKHLKRYARETGDHLLKRSIAEENTGAFDEYELRSELDLINGNVNEFSGVSDLNKRIIDHIKQDKDIQFIVEIFYQIESRGKRWKSIGEEYLKAIFDDKGGTILNIFKETNYFSTSAGRKFVNDVKKYIKKCLKTTLQKIGFAGGTAEVWKYVEEVERRRKKNIIIAMTCCLIVIASASVGTLFYLNAPNKDTIKINIDKVLETSYGEDLDLSGYTITYQKNSGANVTESITEKMLSGYDSEAVGSQQTVYIEFKGVKTGITVMVNQAKLASPVLTQSGNFITWEFVPNASNYNVYVNSSSIPTTTTANLSYDLSSNENYGQLAVTVRANSASNKYNNSAMSETVTITKLQPPSNIRYENGMLIWDNVAGATLYELSINGTPYTTSINSYKIDFAQGDNLVSINAKASSSVVEGVAKQTIYYYHLNPIMSMSYSDNKISWEADNNINIFSVYVDGEYWKDFNRNYFVTDSDGFTEKFGEHTHKISVVCKSSIVGTAPSETVSYDVSIGNKISVQDESISWNDVGTGATYFVKINGGAPYSLSSPYMSVYDARWQEGINTVEVTAKFENREIICESVSITKLNKPTLTVAGNNWQTDGSSGYRFKINDAEWVSELPDVDSLSAGEYTVTAQKIKSSPNAFEIASDTVEIKVAKLAAPVISVANEQIVCTYDEEKYNLSIYYSDSENGVYTEIQSLANIIADGSYYLKAKLSGKDGAATDYNLVVTSDYSDSVHIIKLKAPLVFYNNGNERVTSDMTGVKFYYTLDGVECELKDGLISNLPGGIFTVYARKLPDAANELTSENTPVEKRVSVFNMNITLSINKMTSSQSQFYAVFGGCEDISELTYTYEIKYYDRDGNYIGHKEVSGEVVSKKNVNVSKENIVTTINYRLDAVFEPGYGQTDIFKVKLIVNLSSGSDGQLLSATMNV